jgi:heme exporter protein A
MLSANGLACVRGERRLFSGVDLRVEPGEWLHVRGENGVGKTSLLRLLSGLTPPAEGEVRWCDQPIEHSRHDYHSHMLFLGHHSALKEDLTALENLQLCSAMDGLTLTDSEAIATLVRFGLAGRQELPVRVLSAGQKRRVLLARLLTRKATLWILDEPFTALDVAAVDMMAALLTEHHRQGGMSVLTSHQPIALPGAKVVQL